MKLEPPSTLPVYYTDPPQLPYPEGTPIQIIGQTHRLDLNNRFGTIIGRDGMRTLIILSNGDTLSIADAHLKESQISIGSKVTIVGLKTATIHNGQIGTVLQSIEDRWNIALPDSSVISVKSTNMVLTPQANENIVIQRNKRKDPVKTYTLPQNISLDIGIVINPIEPILKRCGSLRKIIFTSPHFACKCVSVLGQLSRDQKLSSRGFSATEHLEGMRLAEFVSEGRFDGSVKALDLSTGELSQIIDRCMVLADRHCSSAHLIAAIDENYSGITDHLQAIAN
jgi:hypothetical protein